MKKAVPQTQDPNLANLPSDQLTNDQKLHLCVNDQNCADKAKGAIDSRKTHCSSIGQCVECEPGKFDCSSGATCTNGLCVVGSTANPAPSSTVTPNTPAAGTPTAESECSKTEFFRFDEKAPCKCAGTLLTKDKICCKNEKIVDNEEQCYKECKVFDTKLTDADPPCICGGDPKNIIKKDEVCCKNGKNKETDPSNCKADNCAGSTKCDVTFTLAADKRCSCPSYCKNPGDVFGPQATAISCGGYDYASLCGTNGGECIDSKECISVDSNGVDLENKFSRVELKDLTPSCQNEVMSKGLVCCEINVDPDAKPKKIQCTDICKDPIGCICPNNCLSGNETYSDEATAGVSPPANIRQGFTCMGKYSKESGARSARCISDKKDGQCPNGCFWFNDKDCGKDANLGNVMWDFVLKKAFKSWYDDKWVAWMHDLGARFDMMYWAESFCNPTSNTFVKRNYGDGEPLIGSTEMVGWIGGKKDIYGPGNYSYSASWYLANLPEENRYNISFTNPQIDYYPLKESFNISAGEAHQGENYTIGFVSGVSYSKVCINFESPIRYISPDRLNPDGRSVKEVCRELGDT